jgi:transient receptor potential cation channel subfamily A protein 1
MTNDLNNLLKLMHLVPKLSGILNFWAVYDFTIYNNYFFGTQVLPMVLLFIVAFAMAFSVLMPQDQGFTSIPISLLTTFVMMTGEVDYRDTFLGNTSSVGLHYVQKWFLVIFLILVTIGLTNLLTGLAVGDTAEIMKRARQEKLLHKVRSIN